MLEHGGNIETWGSGVAVITFRRMVFSRLLASLVRETYGDLAQACIQEDPRRKYNLEDGVGQASRDPEDFPSEVEFTRCHSSSKFIDEVAIQIQEDY